VDLDPDGPLLGDGPTLAELVQSGPTRSQLDPPSGAAGFLSNGGVDAETASEVITALIQRWPRVVLRCAPRASQPAGALAVLPLLPEPFTPVADGPIIYQRCAFSPRVRPEGTVLPIPRRRTVEALLGRRRPSWPRDPWLRAVGALWGRP
jgi:hypothetical protein